jgi:hypothetical protein
VILRNISHALVRLTARCNASVRFLTTWMNERPEIVMRIAPASCDAENVIESFVAFLNATPAHLGDAE